MRYNELTYGNVIIRTSSDMCVLEYPGYTISGMGNIENENLSINDDYVYVIDNDFELPIILDFELPNDTLTENTRFNYSIFNYNQSIEEFDMDNVYTSSIFVYNPEETTHTNTINTSELPGEGEYLLKVSYQVEQCTEFGNKLGKRVILSTYNNNLPYGTYDENNDKYFIIVYRAQEPLFDLGNSSGNGDSTPEAIIRVSTIPIEIGVNSYPLSVQANGDIVVTWNGLVLTNNQDYVISNGVVTFNNTQDFKSTDLVNLIYFGSPQGNGTRTKSITVQKPVNSGPVNEQSDNDDIYLNTDSNKYEVYTDYRISNDESVVLMINGLVMTRDIDYLVSISNKKRLILNGELSNDDVITIIYNSGENLNREITQGYVDINWYVNESVNNTLGNFIIEFSKSKDFISIDKTVTVPYVANQNQYSRRVQLDGYNYGQKLHYRIINNKEYRTISQHSITTSTNSDVITIEMKTNNSNNY